MKYQPPFNNGGDPDASWINGNPSTGTQGSIPSAAAFEQPLRELHALIAKSGLTPSDADLTQLAQAIRSQALNYRVAGGTATALTVTLDPAPAANVAGMPLRILMPATPNEPDATLNAGPGALPIRRMDGQAVARGDLPAGALASLVCSGTAWVLTGLAYSEVYRPAIGKITVWVRSDGNDANDGSANTAAKAKQTIARAINDTLRNVILNGQELEVKIGLAGTYAGANVVGSGTNVTIIGDTAAPQNYVLTEPAGQPFCARAADGASLTIRGCRLSSTFAGAALLAWALRGGRIRLETADLTRFVSYAGSSLIYIASAGSVSLSGAIRMIGAEGPGTTLEAAVKTEVGGVFEGASFSFPASIQPYNLNCTTGFASAATNSSQNWLAATISPVGSGNFGKRYTAVSCGVIDTGGAGATFFPGASAGSTATGGQYV